ncbi:MAG: hypothetical protein HFF50_00705 [Lawsonibacter sp.]|nr:hypothetical protein [Lawsonibacter sp.]
MEKLMNALMLYASEHRVKRYELETYPEDQLARQEAEKLLEYLKSLGPEAEQSVKRLNIELETVSISQNQAYFLAGLSIGLELGRL